MLEQLTTFFCTPSAADELATKLMPSANADSKSTYAFPALTRWANTSHAADLNFVRL
jgi:hypothetical protein